METKESVEDKESVEGMKRELKDVKKKNEELLSMLRYSQADMENYRKRMDKELKDAGESLAKSLITKLLTVQDELELAARHASAGKGGGEIIEGIRMVGSNLNSALQAVGVEKIEALGRPFDPSVHEAVAKVQGDGEGPDMVVEEVRPGYMFRGQLLRPSMVKVELSSRATEVEERKNE